MRVATVEDLGICYAVRRSDGRSLKRRLLGALRGEGGDPPFWALRGVSLAIDQGDTLGIIGRNGAGKTTLCMALARILEPDKGNVEVHGRVAPILSLGVGLSRDLTARENIYLGGCLMGLRLSQLREFEQAILDFAELGDVADNSLRTFSSGMRARLAFAIATAVEPDVLLLDEVLSVGDAGFRAKARERVAEMMEHARAVVIVSHSNDTLRDICNKAIWLDRGELKAVGPTEEVLARYERAVGKRPRSLARDVG